ncbi:hypothetical protein [Nocardioides sp. Soil777]|uniref:hypothetical protein n=1 Tax=Nocardioides sp. Soil777 TaxID=1736409 RepID=UPI0009EB194E|nr:hypothetical protein [Nocardioides sp. Soil777]
MDDAAYVGELLAILTNPTPTGIDPADPYGQADDGIDRYDGFGRDVRVTSARLVPGEHGAQVEVGFVLVVPDDPQWQGLAREGTVTVPLDAEWLRLSGYADPAAYAPVVARRVESAAHTLVARHRSGARPRSIEDPPDAAARWQVLLDGLAGEGAVREVEPGRLELALDWGGGEQWTVTVLVSPHEWDRVLLRHYLELAPQDYFTDLIGPLDPDRQPFIVFWEDNLVASSRAELPPVDPPVETPFVPGGAWFAYGPDGSRRSMDEFPPGSPESAEPPPEGGATELPG